MAPYVCANCEVPPTDEEMAEMEIMHRDYLAGYARAMEDRRDEDDEGEECEECDATEDGSDEDDEGEECEDDAGRGRLVRKGHRGLVLT
jgi:hypothetical protein